MHIVTTAGIAKKAKALILERGETTAPETKPERLAKLSGDAWKAILDTNLRGIIASVKNRRELVTVVLTAAQRIGSPGIPFGWIRLEFETKSVMVSSHMNPPVQNVTPSPISKRS